MSSEMQISDEAPLSAALTTRNDDDCASVARNKVVDPDKFDNSRKDENIKTHCSASTTTSSLSTENILSIAGRASPAVLIAVLSGAVFVLVLLLGKTGLFIVGVLCGTVFHAAIQSKSSIHDSLFSTTKLLALQRPQDDILEHSENHQDLDFSNETPKVANALGDLCNSIIRDYIGHWYTPLVPDDSSFPAACHSNLTHMCARLSRHLSSKRPAELFLMTVFATSNTMIVFMRELSQVLSSSRDMAVAIPTYLASNPNSALLSLLDRNQQSRKLGSLAHEIIENFTPRGLKSSGLVSLFLRQILRGVILQTTIEKLSDPEWLNGWIVHLLEGSDDSTASKEGVGAVLQAFDRSVAGAADGHIAKTVDTTKSHTANTLREAAVNDQVEVLNEADQISKTTTLQKSIETSIVQPRSGIEENLPGNEENISRKIQHRNGLEPKPLNFTTPSSLPSAENGVATSLVSPTQEPSSEKHLRTGTVLTNARVSVIETAPVQNPPKILKSKPIYPYMIQIEPLESAGWIVMRKYTDFETLHHTLRKVAAVSGCEKFVLAYSEGLPAWKDRYGDELVALMELYLRIILSEDRLVQTEAFYRFCEKDEGRQEKRRQSNVEVGPTWPSTTSLKTMGGGVLGALTKAPQSASEGSKALFGGLKKALTNQSNGDKEQDSLLRSPFGFITPNNQSRAVSRNRDGENGTLKEQDQVVTENIQTQTGFVARSSSETPSLAGRESFSDQHSGRSSGDDDPPPFPPRRLDSLASSVQSLDPKKLALQNTDTSTASSRSLDDLNDAGGSTFEERASCDVEDNLDSTFAQISLPPLPSEIDFITDEESKGPSMLPTKDVKHEGISEQETQYMLEVIFSVISELYSLSSAWMIRRSLLVVAKSMILRPGNATLVNLQRMVQEDVLEANMTEESLSDYLRQLRKNALPTETELKEWEKTKIIRSAAEKVQLRDRARELLAQSLPQGLTALLGVNQTKEAIYQLFDALQNNDVARGFWTSVVAESLQVICQ